jgi:hypothetical protein
MTSLYLPLLFPHLELGRHLAVRYHGDAMSQKTNQIFYVLILRHRDFAESPMRTHCAVRLILCVVIMLITDMRVLCPCHRALGN